MQHLAFCPPGQPFFDLPGATEAEEPDYAAVTRPLDEGWQRSIGPDWVMMLPRTVELPVQGWKIHVSATLANAERILDLTRTYAVERTIPFKFVRSSQVLARRNGKYGDRSASGKFITLYPVDEAHLATILTELGFLLDGEQGPYILSDLRWRSGPLYVRYGGFLPLTTRSEGGNVVHCIKDPAGRLVPDQRVPAFRPPQWVTMPKVLQEPLAARNSGTLHDFPYTVDKAIHFSNGGGIYRGTGRTGKRVLLREARPLAGVDSNGDDAVTRLQRERDVLQQLEGLPCVPKLIDYRIGHEHYFLVREYVDGDSLMVEVNRRHPLCGEGPADRVAEYTQWALQVLDQIERGVTQLHERGVIFGDLHPGNIIVRSDGSICFIDFETASTDPQARQFQGAPGFVVPSHYQGQAVDRYMLACLRIALFVPLSGMLPWGPEKAEQLIGFIRSRFPVPDDFGTRVRADLGTPHQPSGPTRAFLPSASTAVQEIAHGILATATPQRDDRLFPGDAAQFFTPEGGVAFAHGAAGVLWALDTVGAAIPEHYIDWLEAAARRLGAAAPGFYNGLSGIAFTLDQLGRADAARELLDRVRHQGTAHLGDDLYSGLAGLGLTELHLARSTGDREGIDRAAAIADRIADRSARSQTPPRAHPGLIRGASGGALLMLRLHEETADPGYLDTARRLLHGDLRMLGWAADGAWGPGAIGHRPGIATGSGGTAIVLHDFLTYCDDAEFTVARDTVRQQAHRSLARAVSLFHGQAGTIVTLLHLDDAPERTVLQTHLDYLGLQAAQHGDEVAFLGYEGLRISTDLTTGAAGVLLALDATAAHRRQYLPFL